MNMVRSFAALGAASLLLAGCGTSNRGLESVHQPVVERSDIAFDVATAGDGLAPGEAQRLAGWLDTLRLGYGDRIAVDNPSGVPGVHDAVAGEAARHGILLATDSPVTQGAIAPSTARVVVSRMRASVPGCPDHSRVGGTNFEGHTWSNYGCSVNSNLAAMVAQPEDLVRGAPGSGVSDTTTNYKAIDSYRRATPTGATPLQAETTRGAR